MGIWMSKEPPPPVVLVPPLFDFPPLAARTRMLESSYNHLFGKLALKCLFEDYFDQARHFSTMIMLKPVDDPHVDMVATVSGPVDNNPEERILGNATFRWQSDVDNPHMFMDLLVSNSDPVLQMRSCYHTKYGLGAFGIFPLILNKRKSPEDYGVMGLRYGSSTFSTGITAAPFPKSEEYPCPKNAWIISRIGRLTAGVQYEPLHSGKDGVRIKDKRNWNYAVGYGLGSGSPLSPSFNFGLELARNSEFTASFYQHIVVQRRVKNPFEENGVVGITNYIDFGFELQTKVDNPESQSLKDASFQLAASWQANKNFLLKGKVGPLSSTLALAFKSWWKPSFTFSVSATRDRTVGNTSLGFSLRIENLREASYQRADPNFVMLTPSKEHIAVGKHWEMGNRPVLQSDVDCGNFDGVPRQLRPLDKIL